MPFESGRWRVIPHALRACQNSYVTPSRKCIRTRHDFRMCVDVSEWLGRHVYVTGEYEPATSSLIFNLLPSGGVFVDVGANAGYFSLLAARIVGPKGHVLSIEPIPATFQRLEENIRLNGFTQCEMFNVAASNSAGSCEMFVGPTNHTGVSSFRKLEISNGRVRVATETLDALCSHRDRIDAVKIDVEGAECHVLEGMTGILERFRPHVVAEITPSFLETMDRSAGDIEQLFKPYNYSMFAIEHTGLRPLRSLADYGASQFNALFSARPSSIRSVRILT